MKVEVLIRMEGDFDPESQHTPELFRIHREESLAFAPGVDNDAQAATAALAKQTEELIDGAVGAARDRLALMADHIQQELA